MSFFSYLSYEVFTFFKGFVYADNQLVVNVVFKEYWELIVIQKAQ